MVSTLGPIGGVILAGSTFDRIGGYTGPKTIPICAAVGIVAMLCGVFSVFPENVYVLMTLLSIQLFGGGFAMPALTGSMLNQVPSSSRALANSIANLVYNLLGYLPAPFAYGLAFDLWGGHWGLISLQSGMIFSIFMAVVLLTSSLLKNRKALRMANYG